MPLKGVWLQQFVYADPADRPITDVDVLVPATRFEEALAVLRDAGWHERDSNANETAVRSPEWPLPLDVHRRLFDRRAFDMPPEERFARGTLDEQTFGASVILPDPLDVFAHLVGHFVKSRGARGGSNLELRDLPALAERFALEPATTARHLERCGLGRACRYALQCVPVTRDPTGFCQRTLRALQPDPVGRACAATMLALRERVGVTSPFAIVPGFALEPTLPRAVRSALSRAFDRAHSLTRAPRA